MRCDEHQVYVVYYLSALYCCHFMEDKIKTVINVQPVWNETLNLVANLGFLTYLYQCPWCTLFPGNLHLFIKKIKYLIPKTFTWGNKEPKGPDDNKKVTKQPNNTSWFNECWSWWSFHSHSGYVGQGNTLEGITFNSNISWKKDHIIWFPNKQQDNLWSLQWTTHQSCLCVSARNLSLI